MKTPFNAEDIVANAFSGHATDEELADLRRWLGESEANRRLYDTYLNSWIMSKAPYAADRYPSDRAWEALVKRKSQPKGINLSIRNFLRVAAIFIFVLSIMGGLLWMKNNVLNVSSSYIVYTAPSDSVLQITLPDLSQVWLNQGSSLRFPDNYNTKNRDVYLEGEGFFDVNKNDELPFVVHTGSLQISVVGTSFNVNAYPENPEWVATLIQGKIDVHLDPDNTSCLLPNQQLVYQKETKAAEVRSYVNTDLFVAWMKDVYKFEDKSFEEITAYLEKLYHVRILFENTELKFLSFSGSFLRGQKLEEALELLQGVRGFQYDIKDQTVIIRK